MVEFISNEEIINFLTNAGLGVIVGKNVDPKGCAVDRNGFKFANEGLKVPVSLRKEDFRYTAHVILKDDSIYFDDKRFAEKYISEEKQTPIDLHLKWMEFLSSQKQEEETIQR